ncbi:hypothetical protein [Candidatus Nanohalococcus occultus]|uniref:GOLD domain-containing protein n=1 Tax=Candidatus Nanohalococcus occultus TaxID=2978047 RepID=A0ABY8CHW5_9ARCH|nr:hypothetical protein SVXNc_0253 [Candidatus Nanohaloarchaeota archaeon SVXNc]
MDKFWLFCFTLLAVGIGAITIANMETAETVEFTDLETECQVSEQQEVNLRLADNKVVFDGHFPENDSDAELSYNYRQTADEIVLNIKSKPTGERIDFFNDCYASVVYRAQTPELEQGPYNVIVKHNGEDAGETTLRVN